MSEELKEVASIVKREGVKSVLVGAGIVILAVLSYNQMKSGDDEFDDELAANEIPESTRTIASIDKQSFVRKIPSIETSITKEAPTEEDVENDESILSPEDQRLAKAEQAALKNRSTTKKTKEAPKRDADENAEILLEDYEETIRNSLNDDFPGDEKKSEKPIPPPIGGGKRCPDGSLDINGCPELTNRCPDGSLNINGCPEETNRCPDGSLNINGCPEEPEDPKTCEETGTCPPETPACTPSMIVFPDNGPGTYTSNPTVALSSPDSKDIYYCLVQIPGSCDPEPSLDGIPYTSSLNIGATNGNYILSFLANEDSCAKKYVYSYEVDSSKPDLQVAFNGGQYLQTTERIDYQMNSANAGSSNHFFWMLKLEGATEFNGCKSAAESFSLSSFGMDFIGSDGVPDESDLNVLGTPLNLDYTPKDNLSYGKVGSQFVSIISDRTTGTHEYGCRMNHVFLNDFPAFDFKTTYEHTVNGNGEIEFTGGFNSFDAGRYPASGSETYLEVGFETIVN